MRLGVHVSIGSGLGNAARRAVEIGCESVQMFSSNPSSWQVGRLDEKEAEEFKEITAQAGISPVILHTPYLINLASQSSKGWANSWRALASALSRADKLGAAYVVTHIGSHGGVGIEAAGIRVRDAVMRALDTASGDAALLLEGSAGSGNTIGASFEELAYLLNLIEDRSSRVGVCIDTAHMYGAGYDLAGADNAAAVIAEFDRIVGLSRLGAVHLNDTQKTLASRVDRHWHIGRGNIGLEGFRALVNHPALADKAGIIETPEMDSGFDEINLNALKSLRKQAQ